MSLKLQHVKDLKKMQDNVAFNRVMEGKYERMANEQEKCVQCLAAKTYKICPPKCLYIKA